MGPLFQREGEFHCFAKDFLAEAQVLLEQATSFTLRMHWVGKFVVAVALTAFLVYILALHSTQIQKNVAVRDSIAYWAAARLLIHDQNPYDSNAVLQMEHQQGYSDKRPLVLRTPPWSLFMVMPLGFLNPFWAWTLWIGMSVTSLFIGMRLCNRLYGTNGTPQMLFTLIGYSFAPVLACLVSGQMGLILMLGVVLFFLWEPEHPFLAGLVLILPFAKPHLLGLFWLVFVLWIILRRRYKIAAGFLVALVSATALALSLDRAIFRHYREMLHVASIGNEFIPALSGVLRLLFFRQAFWVQFLPVAVASFWCIRFFFKNASAWDWREHGPALLAVSVLTTPYEWLSDETVLLPAVLQGAAFVYAARASLKIRHKVALVVFALLEVLLLLILKSKVPFSTGIYFWSSLVWFFWYFSARKWHSRALHQRPEAELDASTASSTLQHGTGSQVGSSAAPSRYEQQ